MRSKTVAAAALMGGTLALFYAGRVDARRQAGLAPPPSRKRHRVVVIGAGFGGLNASVELARHAAIDLTVIDAQNHHLFQPLLYQVATAALSPADIASPVRDVIPATPHTRVIMGAVTAIDTANQHVTCDGQAVPYDELVIATGSQPSYFGNSDWEQHAPALKSLHNALDLRGRILLAFERACTAEDPAERHRLLTFVLIGAGPTGVEMAGSIAELAREILISDRELRQSTVDIILVEAGTRVLAEFPEHLSEHAAADLQQLGISIRLGSKVTAIKDGVVELETGPIPAGTIIWTAGIAATPVAAWLGLEPAKGGRVSVEPDLRVPSLPHIHVIGDAALALDRRGKPLPGLAPVAKQQGLYVAKTILQRQAGQRIRPFHYRDYGTMATIGRAKAVADFGIVRVTGWPAWGLWAVAHIFFLIGFRNRFMVSAQWALAYATDKRPGRLIAWNPTVDAKAKAARSHSPV